MRLEWERSNVDEFTNLCSFTYVTIIDSSQVNVKWQWIMCVCRKVYTWGVRQGDRKIRQADGEHERPGRASQCCRLPSVCHRQAQRWGDVLYSHLFTLSLCTASHCFSPPPRKTHLWCCELSHTVLRGYSQFHCLSRQHFHQSVPYVFLWSLASYYLSVTLCSVEDKLIVFFMV